MTQGLGGFRSQNCAGVLFLPVLLLCIALLFSGIRLEAQSENATYGTVVDASGAVIAGAQVKVTNISTGVA